MIQLYNTDAISKLKELGDSSVDCIITDVPYRTTSRGTLSSMGGYWRNDLTRKGLVFENNSVSPKDYIGEFYRILKDGSHCYIMINNLNLIEMLNEGVSAGFHFVKCLIWDKQNKICGTYYMGCFEYIILFRKGKDKPINDCSTPDILSIPIHKMKAADGTNIHNTEKPVRLMRTLVENATVRGETVLDPFMGIGATGVACKETGRDFIGIEIDKRYYDVCEKRINDAETVTEKQQLTLF